MLGVDSQAGHVPQIPAGEWLKSPMNKPWVHDRLVDILTLGLPAPFGLPIVVVKSEPIYVGWELLELIIPASCADVRL